MESVLVTGATGRVGSALAADLRRRGHAVRAAVRRPGRRPTPLSTGSTEVVFDFDRPETFEPALEGVDRVFLIARPGDDDADRVAAPLVDAMRRRRVDHVVNLTAMGVEVLPDTALRRLECAIEESGVGFTHLRPNFFMQIFAGEPLLSAIRARNVLAVPAGDATLSFVDARDVAAVAAVALTEPGHLGQAYTLTGGRAISHNKVAEAVAHASGHPIRYVPLDEESARRIILGSGMSAARAERLIGFYRHVRGGHCSPISSDIERVLGRPPLAFEQFARDYAAVWTQGPGAGV
jgi:uncharacterized protein YbjT (DUF2867 family)